MSHALPPTLRAGREMERRSGVTTMLFKLTSLMTSFLTNVCLCQSWTDHNNPANNGLSLSNTHPHTTHTNTLKSIRANSALSVGAQPNIYLQYKSPDSWAASSSESQPGGCQGGRLWRCTWGPARLWSPGRRSEPRGRQQESCNPGARPRGCGPADWSGWCPAASSDKHKHTGFNKTADLNKQTQHSNRTWYQTCSLWGSCWGQQQVSQQMLICNSVIGKIRPMFGQSTSLTSEKRCPQLRLSQQLMNTLLLLPCFPLYMISFVELTPHFCTWNVSQMKSS